MIDNFNVFNRDTVRRHRDRAAENLNDHEFLFAETGERLCDRLDDIKREFPIALEIGCRSGGLRNIVGKRGNIKRMIQSDISQAMCNRAGAMVVVSDEEFIPFAPKSFDLVMSNLTLHWVNDLPGCLTQIHHILKQDGLFLANMLGGDTLKELRQSLSKAELKINGVSTQRISPFADVKDAGNLLQRSGFALPVTDTETITVSYSDPFKLMNDLRAMGESNATIDAQKGLTSRKLLMEASRFYLEDFAGEDGRIPASFQVINLSGWSANN